MSEDDVFKNTRDAITAKKEKSAKAAARAKITQAWNKSAATQAAQELEPYKAAVDGFLTQLEEHLGLHVYRGPGRWDIQLEEDAKHPQKNESYSFTCIVKDPEKLSKYDNIRDHELTITLFATYDRGQEGKAENIDVQIAIDDPLNRGRIWSKTTEAFYGGSDTDYYCSADAIKNPHGADITKVITDWLIAQSKDSPALEKKILRAPKIAGIKFPHETGKSSEGNRVRVHTNHTGYYPIID